MEKPKLTIQTPLISKIFNAITLIAFFSAILYLISQWPSLPDQVPTHYNILNKPDNWGQKAFIFIPLLIGIVLWIGQVTLHRIQECGHKYNILD